MRIRVPSRRARLHLFPQDDEIRHSMVTQYSTLQDAAHVAVLKIPPVRTKLFDQSEPDRRIRGALKRFLGAHWAFSLGTRRGQVVGCECVSRRVALNQNKSAHRASSKGLPLGEREVDCTLPFARLSQVAHEMRAEIIEQLEQHRADFAAWTDRARSIGSIGFGAASGLADRRTSKGAYWSGDDVAFSMALDARFVDDETASATGRSVSGLLRKWCCGRPSADRQIFTPSRSLSRSPRGMLANSLPVSDEPSVAQGADSE